MDTKDVAQKAQHWQEKARGYKERAQEWQERAVETARGTGQAVNEYVQENVWLSIGIAAALGCVIGMLLANSRD